MERFFERLKECGSAKRLQIAVLLIVVGAMLMLFGAGGEKKPQEPTGEYNETEALTEIIRKIDGVSTAEVLITYYGTAQKSIVYDTRQNGDSYDRQAVVSGGEVIVSGESFPRIKGVVVVAQCRGTEVHESIREAVSTALGLADYKICILDMER